MLPAGPTVADVVANAAFYYGLVRALAETERPVWTQMSFAAAADNLVAARGTASTRGLLAGHGEAPVTELALRRLLPLAVRGLRRWGVQPSRRRPDARHHRAALPAGPDRRDLAGRTVRRLERGEADGARRCAG